MKKEGKTINSEGCPKGEAWGTSQGINFLAWVFYIKFVFFLNMNQLYMNMSDSIWIISLIIIDKNKFIQSLVPVICTVKV